MSYFRHRALSHFCVVILVVAGSLSTMAAEDDYRQDEFKPRPTPKWVQMIDQGETDARLAGLKTPAGIKVEIVSEQPAVVDPVGMTFDESGRPLVLEWRVAPSAKHSSYDVEFTDGSTAKVNRMSKDTRDELKVLLDDDNDGIYESSRVLLDDLEIPSSILVRDGWHYLPSIGRVIRRRQSKPGGPFDVQEEVVKGLCGFHHHQASGVTMTPDGWLMITSGDDDNRAEGSDGSRATVLRTGAIFRCRPDGSQVAEYARGFRNPYRNVVYDCFYNMFHVDNDQEDGSKFQGVRLMNVQEGADYGWRLLPGAVCCRTDMARGAVFGERPGKVPSMLKTGRGSPAGLLNYQGEQFPKFFQGLLIYPDVFRKLVRAYRVERAGSTFRVIEQFTLMSSDDGLFRPCQALQGPDGAIYIVDWRTDSGGAGKLWGDGKHGRIYRLSWSGNADVPAIPLASRTRWAELTDKQDTELVNLLSSQDGPLRDLALEELCRRGSKSRKLLLGVALDRENSPVARAAAMGGMCRFYFPTVERALVELLGDDHAELRRLAAELLGRNSTKIDADIRTLDLIRSVRDKDAAARRSKALALGTIAARLPMSAHPRERAALHLLSLYTGADSKDAYLRDGILRGLERLGETATDTLLSLFALEPVDREVSVSALESMRTRQAAQALDLLVISPYFLDDLTADQRRRVFEAYRNIQVEPPINADIVAQWLKEHEDAAVEVQVAGLETLGLVGCTEPTAAADLAIRLLEHDDPQVRVRAVSAIGNVGMVSAAKPLVKALRDDTRELAEQQTIVNALGKLRSRRLPFLSEATPPGVETVLDELVAIAQDAKAGAIRSDILSLLAQVDFSRARTIAKQWLQLQDLTQVRAAINVLARQPQEALLIGGMFIDGDLDRSLLPQVGEALRRHAQKSPSGPAAKLLKEVFRGGLLVETDPEEVKRVERLVEMTGNATRGRDIYLDAKRSQCVSCHKLEGHGGAVGPDLTKVYQTHTVAKLIESIVDPSHEIKEGFSTWVVTTKDGLTHSGLKISDDGSFIVLRDQSGKDIRIAAEQVEEKEASQTSLMPAGLISQLSFNEFVDLIAFLKSKEEQTKLRDERE